MKCEVLDILYVKANGEVLCHDDFGERVSLGWVRDEDSFSVDMLRGSGPYATIRESFAAGRTPWPGICDRCAFFRPLETLTDITPVRKLKTIQVESSLACALACPACSQGQQIRSRPKPHIMEVAVYDRLMRTLASEGYQVGTLEYCGQGEPLLNPRVPQMITLARKSLPQTRHRIITSGNVVYAKAVGGEHVEEMYVSCDGLRQENYEKYRVNGSVDAALKFMADTKKADPSSIVIWKYILFIVDELIINSNGMLNVRGWAADRAGKLLKSIEGSVNGKTLGSAKLGQSRGDVLAAYPAFASDRVGFLLSAELPEELRNPPGMQLRLRLTGEGGERDEFVADYQFG